eukprot:TRINITY_DN1232_c0_g1_i2.p1 TRINITY_DN1232_c0_g1~~TRINITY_DN1232_c0_g1_i2.p1  ORF type:complete len:241 (-),score=72.61 TRINITY_DN1232_c0_g1_i2:195-917(-)
MEEYRKQAVMLDAINDYKAELEGEQGGGGYQGVGNGCPCDAHRKEAEEEAEVDIDALLEEDDEMTNQYREQMMAEMMDKNKEQQTWHQNGHGKLEEICEEDFLKTCSASKRFVCAFYHSEMRLCAIMNEILGQLAPMHMETKFAKVDAQKCPFFVTKLMVQMMPAVVMFEDGKVIGRMDGLELLGGENMLSTENVEVVLGASGVIDFKPPEDWVFESSKQFAADIVGLNAESRASDSDDE